MPLVISGAIHVALLAAALVLGARLAPRIEAVIHAELVEPDVEPPLPPAAKIENRMPPPPRPKTPPAPRPVVLPRLLEATLPTAPPAALLVEIPPAPPAPTDAVPIVKLPTPKVERHEAPPPPAEPPRSVQLDRGTREPAVVPSASGGPSAIAAPDGPPPGVSMLATLEDGAAGAAGTGALRASGNGAGGGGSSIAAGAGPGRGTGSTGGTGSDISRVAIPRGGYQVQPRYPPTARRLGIQGTTLLRVFVAIDGRVADVNVERTAGHADLDEAAADAVRRWRFEPARQGDEPVAMWVLLPVEFRLK